MTFGELFLDVGLGFGIGLLMGLLGAGGSILTVPALVYIIGQTPQAAMTASLVIVAANSALGASFHYLQGSLRWRLALVFGGVGMGAAYLTATLSHHFPPAALLIAFAALMMTAGVMMIRYRTPQSDSPRTLRWPVILATALGVGAITGLLGVGGGFMIVPALVILVGIPMQQAVGTSLAVIAMNGLAGLIGRVGGAPVDIGLVLAFVTAGLVGTFTGARLTRQFSSERLRVVFGVFVIILGLFLLLDNVPDLLS